MKKKAVKKTKDHRADNHWIYNYKFRLKNIPYEKIAYTLWGPLEANYVTCRPVHNMWPKLRRD